MFNDATTACDGTSCSVECNSPDFFLHVTGCEPDATQVSVSDRHGCAVLFDGTMRCWGGDFSGQLGLGAVGTFRQQPVVPDIEGVVAIGLGQDFTCALRTDRTVWCWGANTGGQLGRGNLSDAEPTPAPVVGIDDALALSVGAFHSCVLRPSGLYCWGSNVFGEVAIDPAIPTQSLPVQVSVEPVSQVSAGGRSTCVLLSGSGAVRCWGQSSLTELAPEAGDGIRTVVARGTSGCVVLQSDTVRCWGEDGTSTVRSMPELGAVSSLALAERVACVVSPEGVVSCSGNNEFGQLGRSTTSLAAADSEPVSGLDGVEQLAVGNEHVCALRGDGSVWCWGNGSGGLLGTYRVASSAVPVAVEPW